MMPVQCSLYRSQSLVNKVVLPNSTLLKLIRPSAVIIESVQKRDAGHSKWANIRHIKAAKDEQKMKTAQYILNKMKVIVAETGSVDPKFNSRLANALVEGKNKGVTNNTMLAMLKRLSEKKTGSKKVVFEGIGLGQCFFMIEALTDRVKWTKDEIHRVLKKYGGGVGAPGYAAHVFNHKGVVYVPVEQPTSPDHPATDGQQRLSEEAAMELAIEAEAEEVEAGVDDGNSEVYQFICAVSSLHRVRAALEERGIAVTDARLEFLPHTYTSLKAGDELDRANNALDELEAVEDVIKVYSNIRAEGDES